MHIQRSSLHNNGNALLPLTEDATSGNPWAPDAKTMSFISRAAFEIDDFWRIVQILHKRLAKFDRKYWREPYNALVLLEHLLTHGPESVADEFLCDKDVINQLGNLQHIDERGFNWGFAVRKKSERVLKLLEKGQVLKEERDRARKVTRGIQGFGSLNQRWSSQAAMDGVEQSSDYFGRWNSHYEGYSQQDDEDQHSSNSDSETADLKMMMKKKKVLAGEGSINGEIAAKGNETAGGEKASIPTEESKVKLELQNEEHPFDFHELQRKESMLLLRQF
ncbi:clathrin interactor EPSIN 1-like isoform X2 [Phalaenopsis equestris]|uniref:clathrin interactor EPSIN 1-like isoform X2 n=1 Tax=Phalaenopsis equestris TaxID=78828 RepID=UPI0009E5D901|nr:clathrin interactor EPSIN 1-like isoform X2 [Phalaenopsis equestris]